MYIPVTDSANAKELSEKLYKLSRPTPDPQDITTSLITWIVHPVSGAVMADIPDGTSLPISSSSNPKILATLLEPFVTAKKIAANDLSQVELKLAEAKGKKTLLIDILPAFWLTQQKSYTQLKGLGWFPDPLIFTTLPANP